ncbi:MULTISPECIES: CdaR family protein [Mediterraneibacter]|jgi:YbbR domain-containing protein|uniref:CdaR family protein n=1 Tax=Mediterraneibacter TaxID=2316020 RepID=UPI000E502B2D|nr:CdaR family protein [Mediterraneibacter massiliensis]RGT72493.1 hypothetical protein DWX08_09270 [Ruminococcus sp. AF18-22]
MKKDRWKQNFGLKIMAFVFAALLWLIVVNIDDPVSKATFSDVDVMIVNPEIVTNQGKVYQVLEEQKTSVTVYAKRSVLSDISKEDIVATADLSEMDTNTYLVPISASVKGYSDKYELAEANPRNLKIKVEGKTKNTFPLTVSATGTPRDGYVVGEMTVNPEKVSIGGSESLVQQISKAAAKIDVSGLSRDTELEAELILYDVNGNVIDQTQLTNNLGEQGISVYIEMLETKTVPLNLSVSGIPAEGFVYTGLTVEPSSIQICGDKEDLDQIEEIVIPNSVIDITGLQGKEERAVDVLPYLPEGVTLAEETANTVVVTVMAEQEGVKTVEIQAESIKVTNLSEKLKVSYEPGAEISLQFTGKEELLETLDITEAVSVDLKKYTEPGVYKVPVTVDVPDGISLKEIPSIKVTLEEKES